VSDDRLRELLGRSHDEDTPPGFAATLRAARAAKEAAPPRRSRLFFALPAAALAGLAALAWLAARPDPRPDPDPDPPPLAAPALDAVGPFDQLPSPFPGLALADLTLDGAGLPTEPDGLPSEDSW